MFDTLLGKPKTQVSLSPSIVIFTVLFLGILMFLFRIQKILIILLLSLILMVALNPAVTRFEKNLRLPRILSMIIVYVLLVTLIVSATALIFPPLIQEIVKLVTTINIPFVQEQIAGVQFSFSATEIGNLVSQFGNSVNFLIGAVAGTFTGVFTLVTLFIMSFYLMIDRPHLHKKIAWFSDKKEHLDRAKVFIDDLEKQLGGWVRGQIILMVAIAIATYFGLTLLKIPFALPLAILAGLLEILPNLGPIISAVPAIVVAYLTHGVGMAGATVVLYTVIQQLENNILVPRIMSVNAKVNPLVAMLCVLTGFEVRGVIGALLAIPVYIILRALYSAWRRYSA
jgi:predicted PurR-regulated permease PerM